jgi:superoxide dismutase
MTDTDMFENAAVLVLPPMPYADNALEPVISAKTIGFHYRKHHKGYVDTLNRLIAGTGLANFSLEKLIAGTAGKADMVTRPRSTKPRTAHGIRVVAIGVFPKGPFS